MLILNNIALSEFLQKIKSFGDIIYSMGKLEKSNNFSLKQYELNDAFKCIEDISESLLSDISTPLFAEFRTIFLLFLKDLYFEMDSKAFQKESGKNICLGNLVLLAKLRKILHNKTTNNILKYHEAANEILCFYINCKDPWSSYYFPENYYDAEVDGVWHSGQLNKTLHKVLNLCFKNGCDKSSYLGLLSKQIENFIILSNKDFFSDLSKKIEDIMNYNEDSNKLIEEEEMNDIDKLELHSMNSQNEDIDLFSASEDSLSPHSMISYSDLDEDLV